MDIILNECAWAENALKEKSLGTHPSVTLTRVARYFFHQGYKKSVVRAMLEEFLLSCDPTLSPVKWSAALDRYVKSAEKYPAIMCDGIQITGHEMEVIEGIKNKQEQRLAFTLLCVAKYSILVNPNADYWVTLADSKIMKMSNINTSVKRQSLMYKSLRDSGLIRFSKKIDNLSVQVLFAGGDDVCMTITDYRNLGYQLSDHLYGGYYTCQCCGIVSRINKKAKRTPKYCDDCAVKTRIMQNVNSVMRLRNAV